MLNVDQNTEAQFQRALDILRDPDAPFTAEMIYSLTDLYGERLTAFRELWEQLSTERRRNLVKRLVETAETNFELDFSAIIHPALNDADYEVRRTALEGVLEDSPPRIIERIMVMAQEDQFAAVRAAAASALGQFVLQGEFGKLPRSLNVRLQDTVLALHRNFDEDPDVRRRALEAIANCGHESVTDLIREAYYADDFMMRVSAVFAMGRTCDEVWEPQILEELTNPEPAMRYEAARAAGELELRRALPRLADLVYEDDREIQEAAIWALGEIGGSAANNILTELSVLAEETDDDELATAVEEAQAAASLVADDMLPLLDFSDYDLDLDEEDDDDFDLDFDDDDF